MAFLYKTNFCTARCILTSILICSLKLSIEAIPISTSHQYWYININISYYPSWRESSSSHWSQWLWGNTNIMSISVFDMDININIRFQYFPLSLLTRVLRISLKSVIEAIPISCQYHTNIDISITSISISHQYWHQYQYQVSIFPTIPPNKSPPHLTDINININVNININIDININMNINININITSILTSISGFNISHYPS